MSYLHASQARKKSKEVETTWSSNDYKMLELLMNQINAAACRGEYNIRSMTLDQYVQVRKLMRYLEDSLEYRCSNITMRDSNNNPQFQIEIDWSGA